MPLCVLSHLHASASFSLILLSLTFLLSLCRFAAFRYAQLQNAYVRAKNSRPATAVSKVAKSRITHGIIVAVPIVYGVFKLVRNRDLRMMIGVS